MMNLKNLSRVLIAFGLLSTVVHPQLAPNKKYEAMGIVKDAQGKPLSGAYVTAMPVDGGFAGTLSWVRCDDHGVFRLSLEPSRYELRAKDESRAYPDSTFLLNYDRRYTFPVVSVLNGNVSGLVITLGPKGGFLSGSIRDRDSGEPIAQARVRISDRQDDTSFVEVSPDPTGQFRITLPNKRLRLTATAKGYVDFEMEREILLSDAAEKVEMISMKRK